MRTALLLAGLALVFSLPLTGCDSVGPDDLACVTCGDHPGDDTDSDDDAGSGGSDDDGGSDGGEADKTSFVEVHPRQTYLLTSADPDAVDAPALRLSDWGLEAGDVVCATAVGDFYTEPGVLASSRGLPLVTAIFSATDELKPDTERRRVETALEAGDDVGTWATAVGGHETDVAEDLDATDACVTIPAGAAFVFLAPFDSFYGDNADALVNGQPFGLLVEH